MERIRIKREGNFTTVSNVYLRDKTLSLRAKGLLTLVMSFTDEWELTVQGLISITPEGRDAVKNTIKELIQKGYCSVEKTRGEAGKFAKNDYTFTESPFTEKPSTVKPSTEKRTQLNTELINDSNNQNINKENLEVFKFRLLNDNRFMVGINKKYTDNKIQETLDYVISYHSDLEAITYSKFKEHFKNSIGKKKENQVKENSFERKRHQL